MKFLVAAFLIAASVTSAFAQVPPTVTPAMDGIFDAFKTHSLVGIGEHHRIAQELAAPSRGIMNCKRARNSQPT